MKLHDYLSAGVVTANEFAKKIGVPSPLLSQYRTGIRLIPVERCQTIERWSGGWVTCEEQRPDIVWVRIKDRRWPHPKGRPLVDFYSKKSA